MVHIKIVDTDFTLADFSQPQHERILVPNRNILVNHPHVVHRILTLMYGTKAAAYQEFANFLYLDRHGVLAGIEMHSFGDPFMTKINNSQAFVVSNILSTHRPQVAALILAHNHPNGVNVHSPTDVSTFTNLRDFFADHDIEMRDSYVLGIEGINEVASEEDFLKTLYHMQTIPKRKRHLLRRMTKSMKRFVEKRIEFAEQKGILEFNRLSKDSNACNGV